MKKIILLAAFAFLTACSSEEWSPVLVEDETVESSSDVTELSSSSVEPVIESSSETAVSSSSIVTVSSSSIETVKSSSSYVDDGAVCVTAECAAEYCKEAYNDKIINCETAYIYDCEKYLHDECWDK